ncbi:adenylosuccinate lyase [Candidatus Mcinerneyibacteriota bacterium]|nr:adenylosuccinate lyase [Candidatus Mcinerneyibacteriota bacterium]
MIERYTREKMGAVWTEENKLQKWLDVELAVCEAWNKKGVIPDSSLKTILQKADFNIERVREIEEVTHHDVIAFLTSVAEFVGPDSRYIHWGMTSSDMLDTANGLLMKEAGHLLIHEVKRLIEALGERAQEHKYTLEIGRSHGIHAEPITFGLKLAIWYEEMKRNLKRLEHAVEDVSVGKISGAVGTFANIDPEIEEMVCEKLGLTPAPVSNQVVQRDRYAFFMTTLAVIASTLEKMATELRALQKTEVLEVEEPFKKGQKGSSAMPHKRNPIIGERVCGLARLIRSNSLAAMENVALWHERDISHSSVERVILPDSTIALDYILDKMTWVIANMAVYPDNMMKNLEKMRGLVFSQYFLLQLTQKGVTREEAYALVQRNAMKVWEEGKAFQDVLLSDEEFMAHFTKEEIEKAFDYNYHLRNVDKIYTRLGL